MYFHEEFRKWRVACATATTISAEDLTYPPSETNFPRDMRESVKKAEKAAALLEKQVHEHLLSTYHVWEQLPQQRRSELWGLELARSVGRRQKEIEKLKEAQYAIKQENANLKTQIEQLNHLQQPREFRIVPPATIPIEETFMNYLLGLGASGVNGVGVTVEERHVDLNTMVSRAIDRWKSVIVSTRSAGMGGQKPLDQPTPTATPTLPPQSQPQRGSGAQQHRPQRSVALPSGPPTAPPMTTAPQVDDDENSDQDADADADAEMDEDDAFNPIVPAIANPPVQVQPQLDVPRTRGHGQRGANSADARFAANGNGGMNNRGLSLRRQMPGSNVTSSMAMQQQTQQGQINGGEYTTGTNQGVVCDDPMYMD